MTPATRKVLAALRLLTLDGWPASTREIALQAGLKSPGSTHRHLVMLEQLGEVYRHPRGGTGWLPR